MLAAVETAATAIRLRFGALGLLGAVTAAGGCGGQWRSAAGAGLAAATWLGRCNTNRP
ncbi:hypothetical protein [Mycobacterium riyadhense]|uniref:hypothetical protein n=1 Tax=Mycobacterium riyadhense TaxID=486698 RepID=UPI001EF9E5D6|nr:hypothetical protein [Mycobacterium riyadhense]